MSRGSGEPKRRKGSPPLTVPQFEEKDRTWLFTSIS
jgi:hypothetical protein